MKLIIKISSAIFALLILTITLLLVLVDPNDYKSEIEAQVKNNLNRDLHIIGDIGWTFYPQLGISSGNVELDNLTGFSKPHLVKIEKVSLGINILPLLKGEISLSELTLDGFEFTLLTDASGRSNLENIGAEKTSTVPSTTTSTSTSTQSKSTTQAEQHFFKINKTQLAGININNVIIEVEDLQEGSYQKISINEIKLGQFALNKETKLTINSAVIIDDLQAQIKLHTQLLIKSDFSTIKLNNLQLDTLLTGPILLNGQLTSQLKTDIIVALEGKEITLSGLDINTVISADNLPNKKITTQLNADVTYQLDKQYASIKGLNLKVDHIELRGELSVQTGDITKIRYDLVANEWDLNHFLTPTTTQKEVNSETATASQEATEAEPDLSFLHGLDIDGKLKIAGVKIDKINLGEINTHLIINQGKAQLKPLTAQLYQGLLTFNGEVDESKGHNKYQLATTLKDVQIHQLLIDATDIDLLSGTTSFDFKGQGQGLTVTKIKQSIVGKGNFKLLDGELYGVNIPQEIRALKAKLSGKKAPTADNIKKTDFASLTGQFSINTGLVNNQKLLMLSPVIRLDGSGLIHIIKETLDYKLSISPLSKSKAETDYLDLSGLTIPMLIKGSFSDPKISLDTNSALKEQLKLKAKALEKKAKERLKVEQKRLQEKADIELKKYQDKLDAETQEKIKKEGKKLEDKFKSFFK